MLANADYTVLDKEALPFDGNTYEFEGLKHQNTDVSFIWVDMASDCTSIPTRRSSSAAS